MYHLITNTDIHVFIPYIILICMSVSILSGLLGIGGGFILIPLFIFMGVPAPVAIGVAYAQLFSSSLNALYHYKKQKIIPLIPAGLLTLGGIIGSLIGVYLFNLVHELPNIEQITRYNFVILLSIAMFLFLKKPSENKNNSTHHNNIVVSFKYMLIGTFIGMVSGSLGVGGGFLIIPCLIYFTHLSIKQSRAVSQFNIMCVSIISLIMHSLINQNTDFVLLLILLLSAWLGSEIGLRFDAKITQKQNNQLFIAILTGTILMLIYDLIYLK